MTIQPDIPGIIRDMLPEIGPSLDAFLANYEALTGWKNLLLEENRKLREENNHLRNTIQIISPSSK